MRRLSQRTSFVFAIFYVSSLSFHASSTDSLARVSLITKLPLTGLLLLCSESNSANVWIPEAPPQKDADGSVRDEYAEVSTVFAKPEAKLVEAEVLPSEQAVPWTSLKQEWDLYKKFHQNKNRRQSEQASSTEDSSDEEEEEDEEQDEEDENKLPQAFYGQQNADDDERDFLQSQKDIYTDKKNKKKKVKEDEDSDEEEEDDLDRNPPVGPDSPDSDVDASTISDIQGLEQLTDDEKQAIIDKIFAGAAVAPQAFTPNSGVDSEEDDEGGVRPPPKKGEDDDDDLQDDDGGGKKDKKKKKNKKKKKGKKGGGGWGWKKPIVIPIPPPKQDKGWGWKHDGILEQLTKGSTWERVLSYYHHTHDASENNKGDGWGEEKPSAGQTAHTTGEKLVTKLFKGSFWDRAFQTYVQYKNSKPSKPASEYTDTPLKIDW